MVKHGIVLHLVALATLLLCATSPWLVGCDIVENRNISDQDVQFVDYEQLVAMLKDEKRLTIVVDVRSQQRFAAERLPMAIHIALPEIRANDPRLAGAHNVVVYADGLGDGLSRAAAKNMMARGYNNVFEFAGGLQMWKRLDGSLAGEEAQSRDGN